MVMRNAARVVGSSTEREDSCGPGRGGEGEGGAEKDPQEEQKEQQPGGRASGGVWAPGRTSQPGMEILAAGGRGLNFLPSDGSTAAGTVLSSLWDPNKYLLNERVHEESIRLGTGRS